MSNIFLNNSLREVLIYRQFRVSKCKEEYYSPKSIMGYIINKHNITMHLNHITQLDESIRKVILFSSVNVVIL